MVEKKDEWVPSVRVPSSLREKMDRMKELDPDASDADLVRHGLELLARKKGVA